MNAPESIEKHSGVVVPYPGSPRKLDAFELAERRRRSRRATFIKWLRKVQ